MIRKITLADREEYLKMADDFYHSGATIAPVPKKHMEITFDEMMSSDRYVEGYFFEEDGIVKGFASQNAAQRSRSFLHNAIDNLLAPFLVLGKVIPGIFFLVLQQLILQPAHLHIVIIIGLHHVGNGYLLIELLPSLDHRIGKICICPCQRHLPAHIRMHTARPACRRTELCLVLVNINYCHILLLSYIRKKHPRLSLRCFLRC